ILFSVVASAKRAGLDPFAYLRDLLRRLPTHPQSRIGELLPNVWNKVNIQAG
ncbi:transposase domain-containing protein, partial [Candidatus Sumerlaeota bacterium]|nr:transposase domain-containing protein [Candidatus Sumerlaeota bacterium]